LRVIYCDYCIIVKLLVKFERISSFLQRWEYQPFSVGLVESMHRSSYIAMRKK